MTGGNTATEFRVMLEGGNVLVVSMYVEQAEEQDIDPASLGETLLKALGIGRPQVVAPKKAKMVRPAEPSADEWLVNSSRAALGKMK